MKSADRRSDRATRLPSLSAAVCTRDRPVELRRAVESLQREKDHLIEIIVVDNAPSDSRTENLIHELSPAVRYFVELRQGLDFARNRALAEARGEVIAFIDDDVTVEEGWAAALLHAFTELPETGICTGRVLPLHDQTDGSRLFEKNGGFERGARRIILPDEGGRFLHGLPAPAIAWAVSVGSGSSFAIDRSLALSLGGFDEALDLGPYLPGGGDHDMFWRVLRGGRRIVYEPAARSRHEHRGSIEAVCSQIVGHQKGLIAMLTKSFARSRPVEAVGIASFLAWRLVKPGGRLLKKFIGIDPLPASTLWKMWGACWLSLGAYRAALGEAARRREI